MFYILIFLMISCASVPKNTTQAEDSYEEGVRLMNVGNYLDARTKLEFVKNKFPYSEKSPLADLALAELSFLEGNYAQAATEFEIFIELHPEWKNADEILLKQAAAEEKQIPFFTGRDQVSTLKALEVYKKILLKYPESLNKEKIVLKINELYQLLADKEIQIIDFYKKVGFFKAASIRYDHLLESIQNFGTRQEVLESYLQMLKKMDHRILFESIKKKLAMEFPQSTLLNSI